MKTFLAPQLDMLKKQSYRNAVLLSICKKEVTYMSSWRILYDGNPIVRDVFLCLMLGIFAAEIVLAIRWTRSMKTGHAEKSKRYKKIIGHFMRWPLIAGVIINFFAPLSLIGYNLLIVFMVFLLLPLIPYMALLATALLEKLSRPFGFLRKLVSPERKPLLTVVCAVVITLTLGAAIHASPFCLQCGEWHVVHNYYSVIGLQTEHGYLPYSTVISQLGEPKEIRKEEITSGSTRTVYDYGGFALFFSPSSRGDEPGTFYGFEIVSPAYKLRGNAHVGSTRKQIIRTYKHVTACTDYPAGDAYFDYMLSAFLFDNYGDVWSNYVEFEYDENDRVTKITYYKHL